MKKISRILITLILLCAALFFTGAEAQAASQSYTITYVLNGGKNSADNPASYTYKKGAKITLASPTRTGYTFLGWYKEKDYTTKITAISRGQKKAVTVYARWRRNNYKIVYDAYKGTGTMKSTSAKYSTACTLRTNTFTREGYHFLGWSTKTGVLRPTYKDGESVKNLTKEDGATITLYAVWQKDAKILQTGTSKTSATKRSSKKGIQVGSAYEASNYNCDNVCFNLNLADIVTTTKDYGTDKLYTSGKKTYYLSPSRLWDMQSSISAFKENGGKTVTVILVSSKKIPGLTYNGSNKAHYYAPDTWTTDGKKHVQSLLTHISEYIGEYVDYWVVGNEIDAKHAYNEMGDLSFTKYVTYYTRLLRMVQTTMQKKNKSTSALVPFDQAWTMSDTAHFSTKKILEKIAELTKDSDFRWGVSLHPYPVDLRDADWWNDAADYPQSITKSSASPMYTMANIEYVTKYIAKYFRYNDKVRPICITEVGFNATTDGKYSEAKQAAALAYAYYKAEADPYIKLFIYNAMSDNWNRSYEFGLMDENYKKRAAYNVFYWMDTNNGRSYTNKYLKTLKASSWTKLIPKLSFSKFERMAKIVKNEYCLRLNEKTNTYEYYTALEMRFNASAVNNYTGIIRYKDVLYYAENGCCDLSGSLRKIKLNGASYYVTKGVIEYTEQ